MIQIIALLYANQNGIKGLREFESQVIPILREYKGNLISASYSDNKKGNEPDEIHVIQFPSSEHFESYKKDDRIVALAPLKDQMIGRMDLFITEKFHQY